MAKQGPAIARFNYLQVSIIFVLCLVLLLLMAWNNTTLANRGLKLKVCTELFFLLITCSILCILSKQAHLVTDSSQLFAEENDTTWTEIKVCVMPSKASHAVYLIVCRVSNS